MRTASDVAECVVDSIVEVSTLRQVSWSCRLALPAIDEHRRAQASACACPRGL